MAGGSHDSPLEKTVTKNVLAALRAKGAFARKIQGTERAAGLPDVVGAYRGHFLGLEVKRPNLPSSKLTARQRATLAEIDRAGGVAAVVRSAEDVRAILRCVDAGEGRCTDVDFEVFRP